MKVLIGKDDPSECRKLEAKMREWGHEVKIARNGGEVLQAFELEDAHKLLILERKFVGADIAAMCREIRQSATAPYILMSMKKCDTCSPLSHLDDGADDYLFEPFDDLDLQARLYAARRFMDLRHDLWVQASHDQLTAILDHTAIVDIVRRELVRANQQGSQMAIVMADLDDFENINGSYGHLVGDEVLQQTARRIGNALRPNDSVGRYGGDQFLIVSPGSDALEAAAVAERLRNCVAADPMGTSAATISVSISLGVAGVFSMAQFESVDAVRTH